MLKIILRVNIIYKIYYFIGGAYMKTRNIINKTLCFGVSMLGAGLCMTQNNVYAISIYSIIIGK